MSDKDRSEFLTWYQSKINNNDQFDFAKEIVEYCRSDVKILRQACLKFRDILMEITGKGDFDLNDEGNIEHHLNGSVDPFKYITIASVCMAVFKSTFLKEDMRVKFRHHDEWVEGRRSDGEVRVNMPGRGWVNTRSLQDHDFFVEEEEYVGSPIAQVPSAGYHCDQFSKASTRWLEWLMEKKTGEELFQYILSML